MKKLLLPIIAMCTILFTSCDSDSTGDVSSVTFYPNMELNGENLVVLTQGQTYTEMSAKSEAGGATLPVVIEGTVDTNKPGVYKLKYSSINTDGFPGILNRTVIILSNKPSTIDLSGTFTRNGNANNVTKLADRKYICDNATGYNVARDNITLEFYNIDDKQIYAPFNPKASISGISAESNIGTITDKNNWKWVIFASGVFGTAERVFKR